MSVRNPEFYPIFSVIGIHIYIRSVGSGGTKFFCPDPGPVPTGRVPSRSRSRSNWTSPVPIPNPFSNRKPVPVQFKPVFANLSDIFFKLMSGETSFDSIVNCWVRNVYWKRKKAYKISQMKQEERRKTMSIRTNKYGEEKKEIIWLKTIYLTMKSYYYTRQYHPDRS
jgi:hypothetical protein